MKLADLLENLQAQKLLFDQPKYKAIYDSLVREVEEYNEQVKKEREEELKAAREEEGEVEEEKVKPKAIPAASGRRA